MMRCGLLSCGWLQGDVRSGNVVDCEMPCHVMRCEGV